MPLYFNFQGVVLFTIAYLLATLVSLVLLIGYAKDEVLVSPTLFWLAVVSGRDVDPPPPSGLF